MLETSFQHQAATRIQDCPTELYFEVGHSINKIKFSGTVLVADFQHQERMQHPSVLLSVYLTTLLEQNIGLKRPYGYFIQILLHAKGSYLRDINPPSHPTAPSSILARNIVIIEFFG